MRSYAPLFSAVFAGSVTSCDGLMTTTPVIYLFYRLPMAESADWNQHCDKSHSRWKDVVCQYLQHINLALEVVLTLCEDPENWWWGDKVDIEGSVTSWHLI